MTASARGAVELELARMARKHAAVVAAHGGRLGGAELARWSARRRGAGAEDALGAARAYLAAGLRERDAGSLLRAPAALLGERAGRPARARAAPRGASAAPPWLEPYRRPAAAPASSAPTA